MPKQTVVAAAIVDDLALPTRLLAAHRVGKTVGWELPGGKVEPGEDLVDALRRELAEELSLDDIEVGDELTSQIGVWPINARLEMRVWWVRAHSEPTVLAEHDGLRWVGVDDMLTLDWLDADVALVMAIRNRMLAAKRPRYAGVRELVGGVLRPLRVDDVGDLGELWSDPEVTRNLGHAPLNSAQAELYVRGRLADVERGELIALVWERDGRVGAEGRINLSPAWSVFGATGEWFASIGDSVRPELQGQGIGTALRAELLRVCFAELGVRRVSATVFDRAEASARVCEKLGMTRTGTNYGCFRDLDGTWRDDDLYGITRAEWERQTSTPEPGTTSA